MKIQKILNEMTYADSVEAEDIINNMFYDMQLDFELSYHVRDRVIDGGRDDITTKDELIKVFKNLKEKYGKQLYFAKNNPREFLAVVKDITTDLNIAFKIDYQYKKARHIFRAITLMRKRDFRTKSGDKVLVVRT
jgi:hypothetical protein